MTLLKSTLIVSQHISTLLLISTGNYRNIFLISAMTTRKSSSKKANHFAELSEAVDELKTTDVIKSSSITVDNGAPTHLIKNQISKKHLRVFKMKQTLNFATLSTPSINSRTLILYNKIPLQNYIPAKTSLIKITTETPMLHLIEKMMMISTSMIHSLSGFTTPPVQTVPQVNAGVHKFCKVVCNDNHSN